MRVILLLLTVILTVAHAGAVVAQTYPAPPGGGVQPSPPAPQPPEPIAPQAPESSGGGGGMSTTLIVILAVVVLVAVFAIAASGRSHSATVVKDD